MTATEKLITYLIHQQLNKPSPCPPFVLTGAQAEEFLIDLYCDLCPLREILRYYNLHTEIRKIGFSLDLNVLDEKSIFSFILTIDDERRRLKISSDYRFEKKGEVKQIIYSDKAVDLADHQKITPEYLIKRFNHLYFSRNELAYFKLQVVPE